MVANETVLQAWIKVSHKIFGGWEVCKLCEIYRKMCDVDSEAYFGQEHYLQIS